MKAHQRGAALLLAMLTVVLVATLASAALWTQWRAFEIERAERQRAQAAWILNGALDWARLILREDVRTGGADHLGEPWAVPLAEARLSTFLAADKDNNADGDSVVTELSFKPPFAEQAAFTIELPKNFKDDAGRTPANADSFPLPVATGAMPPLAKFAASPFGIVERFAEPGGTPLAERRFPHCRFGPLLLWH